MFSTLRNKYQSFYLERERFLSFITWLQKDLAETHSVWVENTHTWGTLSYLVTHNSIKREPSAPDAPGYLVIHQPSDLLKTKPKAAAYTLLFQTPVLEIWERNPSTEIRQLRFGMPLEEKRYLLSTARTLLHFFLETGQFPNDTSLSKEGRYDEPYGVDIGLWTKGYNRGSIISFENTFRESFLAALEGAATDPRYKPLTLAELPHTKIEISLLSELRIPLREREASLEAHYYHLGYVALRATTPQGWYLPMVCNSRKFSSHTQFIQSLLYQKAKILPVNIPKTSISIFPVQNFIDAAEKNTVLELDGPLPALAVSDGLFSYTALKKMCDNAVSWLLKNTTTEGYLVPIVYADTESPFTIDSARMVFTAHALNTYGKETKHTEGQEVAGRIVRFYEQSVHYHGRGNTLAATYYGHFILSAKEPKGPAPALPNGFDIKEGDTLHRLQKIHLAQLQGLPDIDTTIDYLVDDLLEKIAAGKEISLALYAELLVVTHAAKHPAHTKLCQWYLSKQHACGSFPNTTQNPYAYTRGTGKIIEALAFTGEHISEIHRALHWLSRFQYTEDTLYCIPEEKQVRFIGSLRHDAGNRDAGIDSVGHLLLCVSRLMQNERTREAPDRILPQQMS